ncbi:MAG: hypothetical protein AB7T49_08560 [Oligoflexales bacterium]
MAGKILKILFHALPLVPLALHKPNLTIAAILGVGIPYIKVFKFKQLLLGAGDNASTDLNARLEFWKRWTFLR